MRILIVEDEQALREQLAERLRAEGFVVDVSGIELVREIRKQELSYPILILTARTRWQEKVEGLEAGADDYMVKPFHVEELLARMRALLRRSAGVADSVVRCGPISLDPSSQQVHVDDRLLDLTAYEYRLLQYFMMNGGKVISKLELTEHIYEDDADRDSNVIEVFIGRLRKKIDPDNSINPIETLRGRGYRFLSS